MELQDLANLIRMEYAEMPDLALNCWQAERLWGAPREDCERALALLVNSGYLRKTPEGRYLIRDGRRLRSA
jgi:hypothetical protein